MLMTDTGGTKSFLIKGGKKLAGEISVQGSKNAATKLIAATILSSGPCELSNVPGIKDVEVMLEILEDMGAKVSVDGSLVRIDNSLLDVSRLPFPKISKLRSSVVLIGPLLARFGEVNMPYPGGDKIGSRGLDTHFNAFLDLDCRMEIGEKSFSVKKPKSTKSAYKVVLDEFSVTATENILMYASSLPARTEIYIAAEEPHIFNLISFLNKLGADISCPVSHRIIVNGTQNMRGVEHAIIADYIEAGTFTVLSALAGRDILIVNYPHEDLELFTHKLKRAGVIMEFGRDSLRVMGADKINLPKIQTMIHPGIPTDLQSPIGVLATQSIGETLLHDPLYEKRLEYLKELQKMGADIEILDPHRAIVRGPVKLKGATIEGADIRGGMSLIIAGLIADGETILNNTYQVDRGYEKIEYRLNSLGAEIKRI
ncbi:MAG: UDP-N-acetylglucosamine 1-carboxyvinyltransferase [Candidatus Spechtbacterales bacterium]